MKKLILVMSLGITAVVFAQEIFSEEVPTENVDAYYRCIASDALQPDVHGGHVATGINQSVASQNAYNECLRSHNRCNVRCGLKP